MQVLDEVAPSAPPLHPKCIDASILFSVLDSAPATKNDEQEENQSQWQISRPKGTAPARSSTKRPTSSRVVGIYKKKAVPKTEARANMAVPLTSTEVNKKMIGMNDFAEAILCLTPTEDATVCQDGIKVTPVVFDDQGRISESEWALIAAHHNKAMPPSLCTM